MCITTFKLRVSCCLTAAVSPSVLAVAATAAVVADPLVVAGPDVVVLGSVASAFAAAVAAIHAR